MYSLLLDELFYIYISVRLILSLCTYSIKSIMSTKADVSLLVFYLGDLRIDVGGY